MTTTVNIDCNDRSVDDVMREMKKRLDEFIADTLHTDEVEFWCRGCPAHEIEDTMRHARAHAQALRDSFLERKRVELIAWFAES